LVLDDRRLPTGEEVAEPAEIVRLAGRTFDDGYRLGRDRQLLLSGGRRRLSIVSDKGFPFAQVYAPEGQDFVALEPMTAPTAALSRGTAPLVEPGESHTARFAISLT
jgi:galactose mutarotase-like enzyme